MKLLHTSDWHLGARIGRHDRTPDHVHALRGLLSLAESARPDLILHTGDLFDASRPPYEALELGVQALRRLASVAPTLVLSGNHDSSVLLRVIDDLAGAAEPRRLRLVTRPGVVDYPDVGAGRLGGRGAEDLDGGPRHTAGSRHHAPARSRHRHAGQTTRAWFRNRNGCGSFSSAVQEGLRAAWQGLLTLRRRGEAGGRTGAAPRVGTSCGLRTRRRGAK